MVGVDLPNLEDDPLNSDAHGLLLGAGALLFDELACLVDAEVLDIDELTFLVGVDLADLDVDPFDIDALGLHLGAEAFLFGTEGLAIGAEALDIGAEGPFLGDGAFLFDELPLTPTPLGLRYPCAFGAP